MREFKSDKCRVTIDDTKVIVYSGDIIVSDYYLRDITHSHLSIIADYLESTHLFDDEQITTIWEYLHSQSKRAIHHIKFFDVNDYFMRNKHCRIAKYLTRFKNDQLLLVMDSLYCENKIQDCNEVSTEIRNNEKIILPSYYSCQECPCYTMDLQKVKKILNAQADRDGGLHYL